MWFPEFEHLGKWVMVWKKHSFLMERFCGLFCLLSVELWT